MRLRMADYMSGALVFCFALLPMHTLFAVTSAKAYLHISVTGKQQVYFAPEKLNSEQLCLRSTMKGAAYKIIVNQNTVNAVHSVINANNSGCEHRLSDVVAQQSGKTNLLITPV